MPDPADKGRPSSAPLSVEDADRLADSFTPFWEDARDPSSPVAAQPPAATTPAPATVTAPMPAVRPLATAIDPTRKPIGKQTLLGIAPLTASRQAASLPPPPPAPILAPVGIAEPSPAEAPVAAAQPLPPVQSPVPPSAAIQQSPPDVPGYAIAYTPKDGPSTPAVVIAPDAESSSDNVQPAQSAPENPRPAQTSSEQMRPFAETVPSIARSAPKASLAPLAAPAELADDFNPFAPKRSKGRIIASSLGGALLLAAGVIAVGELGNEPSKPSAQAAPQAAVVPTAPAVPPSPTSEPAATAETSKASDSAPIRLEPAGVAAPSSAPVKRANEPAVAKTKAKAEPTARAAFRASSASSPAESPPVPTKPASKGVIVRDAPF